MREIISTNKISISNIPSEKSNWQKILKFALTFDPKEINEYEKKNNDLQNSNSLSSIQELRAELYAEQRRWNHFGQEPDQQSMQKIKNIIKCLRENLNQS